MSITFIPAGEREYCAGICDDFSCGVCSTAHERAMNLTNVNAVDLLVWLGYDGDPYGELDASDLAARCRRRLWPEQRNVDAGRAHQVIERTNGGGAFICGRPAGRLQEYAERLLRIAERTYSSGRNVSFS